MAPARPQFRRLLAAVVVVVSLSATCGQSTSAALPPDSVQAEFTGIGMDFFENKTAVLECLVKPVDPAVAPFHVACTRDNIWDYGDTLVTLQLEEAPSADLTEAQIELETQLNIVRPRMQIRGITGGRRRSRRTVADLNGPRSILIIILNYDGMVDLTTEAQARLMMQSPSADDKDVNELFQGMSYGGMSFPANLTTVVTVTSPNTSTDFCARVENSHDTARHALELLQAQHDTINPTTFQHKSFLIPENLCPGKFKWSGQAKIRCSGDNDGCHSWLRESSAGILAHELAHNVGLPHGGSDFDDDGTEEGKYGDGGSLMGLASGVWKSVNAPHREVLGYLGDGNGAITYDMTCEVPATAQRELTISRLDLAPNDNNPHPNMVRIARYRDQAGDDSNSTDTNYLLSFKSSADWDGGAGDAFRDRLQIHTHAGPDSRENTLLVKTLREGEVFVGRANRSGSPVPLNVRVVSIGTDAVTVTVNTGCVENLRGYTACGLTVSNAVERTPASGTDVGGVGVEHVWNFTLDIQMAVTFDSCASSVNTAISAISVFSVNTAVARAHANEGCTTDSTPPFNLFLDAGNYSVVLARPGGDEQGRVYSMTMQCPSANFRGSISCGQTVSGDTNVPGIDRVNNEMSVSAIASGASTIRSTLKNAFDHIWHFTLDRSMKVTFDACDSRFDTHLGILGRLDVNASGEVIPAFLYAGIDDGCDAPRADRSRLVDTPLSAGNYSVVIEGYGRGPSYQGVYSMTMNCVATTQPPTRPPTRPPTTPPPTQPPTTREPTRAPTRAPTTQPTTPPTTQAPTTQAPTPSPPTVLLDFCPQGYRNYPTRYQFGMGKVTIVSTHQQCADRCTQFSGPEFLGGCKGYMTGMYTGALYCRSYGGNKYEQACADWAAPGHQGMFSGAFGSIHPQTDQRNIGGRCCSNVTFREAAVANNDGDASSALSSSAAPPTSISTGLVITITIGALVVLYAVYRGGQVYGAKNTPPNAPQPPPAATTNRNHGANLDSESTHC